MSEIFPRLLFFAFGCPPLLAYPLSGGVLGVPSLGIYSLFYAYTRGAASIYSYL